jgi:hypothetical protein
MKANPNTLAPRKANSLNHETLKKRIDGLKGMAWAYAACHSYKETPQAMGKRFTNRVSKDDGVGQSYDDSNSVSNVFYDYIKGKRAPRAGARGVNNYDLVGEVHQGSKGKLIKEWFDSPLWVIFEEVANESYLVEHGYQMPDAYKELLGTPVDLNDKNQLTNANKVLFDNYRDFSSFTSLCAAHRFGLETNNLALQVNTFGFIELLSSHIASQDKVFEFIHRPFLQMLVDFHKDFAKTNKRPNTDLVFWIEPEAD